MKNKLGSIGEEFDPIKILVLCGKIVVIFIALITSLSFCALYVPPQVTVIFQWIGVLLPALLLCNLVFLIIGLLKRSLYSICPFIALFANYHYFTSITQWNKVDSVQKVDIRFATYNVREFKMIYNLSSMEQVATYLKSNNVNALFLQEVPRDCTVADLKKTFCNMPYVIMTGSKNGGDQLAILSKYALDPVQTVSFDERPNCGLIVDMLVKNKKVRLVNCHLQTTNWNQLKGSSLMAEKNEPNWFDAFSIMSGNFRLRGIQVDRLKSLMDSSPFPILLGGDFNTSPNSYSYHRIKGNLKDAFREAGNGYGYTYNNLMKLFRIDFVFFSGAKFQAVNYRTGNVDFSDHLPVLVDFKIN